MVISRVFPILLVNFVNSIADEPALTYDDPLYTCTKFGGLKPFFNPESLWPICKSCMRPMSFVGQINMNDSQFPLLLVVGAGSYMGHAN